MLSSRTRIAILSGCLVLVGLGLTLYKATVLGFPLIPGESRDVWTIEGKISFKPGEGPVEVELVADGEPLLHAPARLGSAPAGDSLLGNRAIVRAPWHPAPGEHTLSARIVSAPGSTVLDASQETRHFVH